MNEKSTKQFKSLGQYPLQVLWFSQKRSHVIFFRGTAMVEEDTYVNVPHTNVVISTACIDALRRLFTELSNRELFEIGALPRCSNTIPAAIRKYLGARSAHGRKKHKKPTAIAAPLTGLNDGKRILVVDDDLQHCKFAKRALMRCDYDVCTVQSGEECLTFIARHGLPHLALIDIQMPGMNGIDLSKRLHKFSDLPIIMFTAVDTNTTIAETITHYAEDYIVKPCSAAELEARVGRVLSRVGDFAYALNNRIRVDDVLQVDFYARKAFVTEKGVQPLTPVETKLLYVLMRHAGQVVTNSFLKNRLWPEGDHSEQLHVFIYRIRQKIEPNPNKPVYIHTKRGVGYRFMRPQH